MVVERRTRWACFLFVSIAGCEADPGLRADGAPARDASVSSGGQPSGTGGAGTGAVAPGGQGSWDAAVPKPDGSLQPPPVPAGSCPPGQASTFEEIQGRVKAALASTPETLAAQHPVTFQASLGYAPQSSAGFDLIQASAHALGASELAVLDKNGFVSSERQHFPTFFYGYKSIYGADLPLYVTVDSVLDAVHRSYDDILVQVEWSMLKEDVGTYLGRLRSNLSAATDIPAETRTDLDVYLAVGSSLLDDAVAAPLAGGDLALITDLYNSARAASGLKTVDLFGKPRNEDFSQFTPRGHYVGGLENYFRAMMWFGRIDFRMLETNPDGSQTMNRRQVAATLAFDQISNDELRTSWTSMDRVLSEFVGEIDYMTPPQIPGLKAALGVSSIADLANLSDGQIGAAISASPYGTQRIASHIIQVAVPGTLPLNRSFTIFGQRYVVDSHVFSNTVFDRAPRMMPNPLDIAFAALGNDQALALLAPELARYPYAPQLATMRDLVDSHDCNYFESNLYTLWLGALRTLSPAPDMAAPAGLPKVARTEAWGRRLLGTQLASWAELRHDTLLYAKQSYTGVPVCEFPDAYVDPYPEAFGRIAALATRGKDLAALVGGSDPVRQQSAQGIASYFTRLFDVSIMLQSIAEHERSGAPLDAAQMAFINDAVTMKRESVGCTSMDVPSGWYARLFYDAQKSIQYDPTIADVHTQPADEAGNIVGKVLHVATGMPRLFVATIDTCTGPRAYAGVSSSYFERITDNFKRFTDEEWAQELMNSTPADPAWMADLVAH
jgi:hypothetical protein